MKSNVLVVFGVSASSALESLDVAGNAVLALAQAQARFWKASSGLERVSFAMNTSQSDTAEKVDEFLRNQVASDHACHAKLYR
mmetsp:Transcript_14370/g.36340  ORF Transcript_14370/g.36340 Transcript_14370/m.36340 type:complete len:83 (+) Transcript_14370:50-298(+)